MATNTEDEAEIRRCFLEAKELLSSFDFERRDLSTLSMGMSDDYRIAVECGSNMVRIGSTIFGSRENHKSQITNHKSQKIRAVFFDQDGVLYNSMPYHAASWAWAMTKHGLPYTAEECYRNEGRTSTGVIQEHHRQMFGTDATPELIEAIYADKSAHFTQMTGGFPGIIPDVDKVLYFLREKACNVGL